MNIYPPSFFKPIQEKSWKRWEQLEADPELAGPWRQLFLQIQSPRHVLSELLQNADDAEATEAKAYIQDNVFVFEHNGKDFNEDQFASLCRFGFSNKRSIHTIGFRGVGFKSTFSLGPTVDVLTPTLAVRYTRGRFTEPIWINDSKAQECTRICIRIEDDKRKKELEKNLSEWAKSPASLLFFQSIKSLNISGKVVTKKSLGKGPIRNSERISFDGTDSIQVLVIHSEEEPFPAEAVDEIKKERIIEDISLPPCRVDIILGLKGDQRLFVVLPTGVRPKIPFSCNAPFIQDPARSGIKDPSISATNQWLLQRIGNLAAEAMLSWLQNESLPLSERCKAYDLLPHPGDEGDTIEGECSSKIKEIFASVGSNKPLLLASDGTMKAKTESLVPPRMLYGIWFPGEIIDIFGKGKKHVLAKEITQDHRKKLEAWGWMEILTTGEVLKRLEGEAAVPKPENWASLALLWSAVSDWVMYDWDNSNKKRLKIVPVKGDTNLHSATNTVRFAAGKGDLHDDDWTFIISWLKALDSAWVAYVNQKKDPEMDDKNYISSSTLTSLLSSLGLANPSPIESLVLRAYDALMQQDHKQLDDFVRITQILAKLDADVPSTFHYVTLDACLRPVSHGISADQNGELESILPQEFFKAHILHMDYSSHFKFCTATQWNSWVNSPKSGLRSFVGLVPDEQDMWGKKKIEAFINQRQGSIPVSFKLKNPDFLVKDYVFMQDLLAHWKAMSKIEEDIWARVLRLIIKDPSRSWLNMITASITQVGYSRRYYPDCGTLIAGWVIQLRDLPCLQDRQGAVHQPAELMMRTPETEALLDVEPFVRADLDNPTSQDLLRFLGVRDKPTNMDGLINRIRSLASVKEPLVFDTGKWYTRLDQVLPLCSSDELAAIRKIFASERIILSNNGEWYTSGEIFQNIDSDGMPDVPLVHSSLRHLSLWTRLGVNERPTIDLMLEWLKRIKTNQKIEPQEMKRVTNALQQCSIRAWDECRHWLSLDRTWVPTEQLSYKMTMQRLTPFAGLFPGILSRTADLRMLSADVCNKDPFNQLHDLGEVIENRITDVRLNGKSIDKRWMSALAGCFKRIELPDADQAERIHEVAERLSHTAWQPMTYVKVTPYINGAPAGTPSSLDVLWQDTTFFVKDERAVKLLNKIVEELARPFGMNQITEAIRSCFERAVDFVEEYLDSVFTLEEEQPEQESTQSTGSQTHETARNDDTQTTPGDDSSESDEHTEEAMNAAEDDDRADQDDPDDSNDSPEDEDESSDKEKHKKPQKKGLSLIERYAHAKGCQWHPEKKQFIFSDGSTLQKGEGVFHWVMYNQEGEVCHRYWVSEHCLENGGIELSAGLWELINASPDDSVLILLDNQDRPLELPGEDLIARVNRKEIILYPAKYRLHSASEE